MQSYSFAKSLSFRFTVIATLSALAVVAFGYVSFSGMTGLQQANDQIQTIAQIVRRHMQGDMMHDAINSDLLTARLAKSTGDTAKIDEAAKEFGEHAEDFQKNFDANMGEVLPPEVEATMDKVKPALEAYLAAGRSALAALKSGVDPSADIATFESRFTFLEEANEKLGDDILKWAEAAKVQSDGDAQDAKLWMLGFACVSLLLSIATPVYARGAVFNPLKRMQRTMSEIAAGRTDIEVPYIERANEMGAVANAVDVFRTNIVRINEMSAQQMRQQEEARREKQGLLQNLARRFEERIQSITGDFGVVAGQLLETAQSMNTVTETTHTRAANVSAESREASNAAQAIAASVEEMSSAAREISSQITRSTDLVKETVGRVQEAEKASGQLRSANSEIGNIVQLIQEITGQINLLALNATIESARAGEAGKGFAVVAAEVKNLASQTSKATEDIAEQISQIQQISQNVVDGFSHIKSSIDKVDQYAAMIAAAAEEQTSTTSEIASNMSANVQGVSRITDDIGKVMEASDAANDAAARVLNSAKHLSDQSGNLRAEVAQFLAEVKAA
jgi:methyl-accepting chemotaxis protein